MYQYLSRSGIARGCIIHKMKIGDPGIGNIHRENFNLKGVVIMKDFAGNEAIDRGVERELLRKYENDFLVYSMENVHDSSDIYILAKMGK